MSICQSFFFHNVEIVLQYEKNNVRDEITKLIQTLEKVATKPYPLTDGQSIKINILGEKSISIPGGSKLLSPIDSIFKIYGIGNLFYFSFGDSILEIDIQNGCAKGYFEHSSLKYPRLFSHRFLFSALTMLLHAKGFYFLHAAGLVFENYGYLFVGKSGSGKSTNTIQLVDNGWNYLSDEALLLRYNKSHNVDALAIPNEFKLNEKLLNIISKKHLYDESFSVPDIGQDRLLQNNKKFLKMDALYPNRFVKKCLPKVIIHSVITQQNESHLIPIKKIDMFKVLIEESPLLLIQREVTNGHLNLLKTLLNQCKLFRLLSGRDFLYAADKLSNLILEDSLEKGSYDRKLNLRMS